MTERLDVLNGLCDQLQDWFDESTSIEAALQVSLTAYRWVQAIEVDQVCIWCSEHDFPDEDNGEKFGLDYLKKKWMDHVKRLISLTPSGDSVSSEGELE